MKTGSLSKPAFIKRADAVCEEGRKDWEAKLKVFFETHQTNGVSQLERASLITQLVRQELVPVFEREIARVGSLGAPPQDKKQVGAVLIAMDQALHKGGRRPLLLFPGGAVFDPATKLADAYGFQACGRP